MVVFRNSGLTRVSFFQYQYIEYINTWLGNKNQLRTLCSCAERLTAIPVCNHHVITRK